MSIIDKRAYLTLAICSCCGKRDNLEGLRNREILSREHAEYVCDSCDGNVTARIA